MCGGIFLAFTAALDKVGQLLHPCYEKEKTSFVKKRS